MTGLKIAKNASQSKSSSRLAEHRWKFKTLKKMSSALIPSSNHISQEDPSFKPSIPHPFLSVRTKSKRFMDLQVSAKSYEKISLIGKGDVGKVYLVVFIFDFYWLETHCFSRIICQDSFNFVSSNHF